MRLANRAWLGAGMLLFVGAFSQEGMARPTASVVAEHELAYLPSVGCLQPVCDLITRQDVDSCKTGSPVQACSNPAIQCGLCLTDCSYKVGQVAGGKNGYGAIVVATCADIPPPNVPFTYDRVDCTRLFFWSDCKCNGSVVYATFDCTRPWSYWHMCIAG